jgi:hypothetical protein
MRGTETLTLINSRYTRIGFSPRSVYHVNIKDVTGISDVQNEIFETSSIWQDGTTYLGSQVSPRNIEIAGSINERDRDIADRLRRELIQALNPKHPVTLAYESGGGKWLIDCRVENVAISKPPLLNKFVIQLACTYPFWRDELETRNDVLSWKSNFEFPVPDGLELFYSDEAWEIGYREPSLIVNVFNGGDITTGIRVEFKANSALSNPAIYNIDTQEFIKLNVNMDAGDVIAVFTGYGEKRVVSIKNGVNADAYDVLDVDSTYMQLYVGDNLFRYEAGSNIENLEVSIYHNNYYLGV